MIKNLILLILLLVGMFAFPQNKEIEILRTVGGDEYQIKETIMIFTDSLYLETDKGFLCVTYAEIDTILRVKVVNL